MRVQRATRMKVEEGLSRKWHVVDADGKILGRMASRVARILQGKHCPTYMPHIDTGDYVVIVNAEKVRLTGRKLDGKIYYRHTGYIGHLSATPARKMLAEKPEEVIRLAVRRMLPKTKLGRTMFGKLKVYKGPKHPHEAQNPEAMEM